jgi:hypothetical protein
MGGILRPAASCTEVFRRRIYVLYPNKFNGLLVLLARTLVPPYVSAD